jgi:thioredoxin reductase
MNPEQSRHELDERWDCVVVGGGSAGLSAALVLGRARRRALVVDAGEQSNLPAAGIGGLLGSDGRPPMDLYAAGRAELAAYPSVEIRTVETVVEARAEAGGFALELGDGSSIQARKLLLAPGMEYRPPRLPGLDELWGGSVFHCPFCHGWEVRGGRLGVLWPGAAGAQKALLLRAWSEQVTLLPGLEDSIGAEQREMLQAAGIAIDERPPQRLRGGGGDLAAVVFEDGSELELAGLLVEATMHQRSNLARRLGVAFSAPPVEERIKVDQAFRTSVPGVLAAGDVCVPMPSVANAVASGSTAAAVVVHELMSEAS